jgi:hypothetical protein
VGVWTGIIYLGVSVAGPCKDDNHTSVSAKCREFLDLMSEYLILHRAVGCKI